MKEQLLMYKDCHGKTVDFIVDDDDKLGITFIDNSYILLELEGDYDGGCQFNIYTKELDPIFEGKLCKELGLYSEEEIKLIQNKKEEKRKLEEEKAERFEYLKLKKKYEGK